MLTVIRILRRGLMSGTQPDGLLDARMTERLQELLQDCRKAAAAAAQVDTAFEAAA
jgi:hypothetical protein